ncbi:MAG: leucine-rich repeat protein [Clostridia bacterium]|nr:leucine-rich repeat protein [Clostridia bacterium]
MMRQSKFKAISFLLVLCMILGTISFETVPAFGLGNGDGSSEENAWSIGAEGQENDVYAWLEGNTLHVSGSGIMRDWNKDKGNPAPWYQNRDEIEILDLSPSVSAIGNQAFVSSGKLSGVLDLTNVTRIGDFAFSSCSLIDGVIFGEGTSLGNFAFNGCDALKSITSGGVKSMGQGAFLNCKNLRGNVDLRGLKQIPAQAFNGCAALEGVILDKVLSLGMWAFKGCDSIENLELGNKANISVIGLMGFTGLKHFKCGDETKVGKNAFLNCQSLMDVEFGNGATIGTNAFVSCSALKSAVFGDNAHICEQGFYKAPDLQTVSFGTGALLDANAFQAAKKLTTVTFAGTSEIQSGAFAYCSSLSAITFGGETRLWPGPFMFCNSLPEVLDLSKLMPQDDLTMAEAAFVETPVDVKKSGYVYTENNGGNNGGNSGGGSGHHGGGSSSKTSAEDTKSATTEQTDITSNDTPKATVTPVAPVENAKTETVTKEDGSKVTTSTTDNGTVATINTDAEGKVVEAKAQPSAEAVKEAAVKNEAVILPIKVQPTENKTEATAIKLDLPENVDKAKVAIPVEKADEGTVAVIVKEDGTEEVLKTSVVGEEGIILDVTGDVTIKIVDNSKKYDDVKEGAWYEKSVGWVSSHEIMKGTDKGFEPNTKTSKAMVTQILFNLDGAKDTGYDAGFADVAAGSWYSSSVNWAAKNEIVKGSGSNFEANKDASREDTATILYNYAKMKGVDMTVSEDKLNEYADAASISEWARIAFAWLIDRGIINGMDGKKLAPKDPTSRAQIASMTQRFIEYLQYN